MSQRVEGAKHAVAIAGKYIQEMYPGVEGLNVEEIEYDKLNGRWRVTIGYWEKVPTAGGGSPNSLQQLLNPGGFKRAYKDLTIDAATSEVVSMKIRILLST